MLSLGPIGTRHVDLDTLVRTRQSTAQPLAFVYEAGPCGAWLSRSLRPTGSVGWVAAPSLSPHKAGDRGQTDRREAVPWARLMRSGDLTPVYVPTVGDAAIRELGRAREAAIADLKAARFRLTACWLRREIRSTGQAPWGPAHRRWLSEVGRPTPAQPIVFPDDVRAVTERTERLPRLAPALQEHVNSWRWPPVVEARQALRGVQLTVAATTVAALGDGTRGEPPRRLRKDLGRIPSA